MTNETLKKVIFNSITGEKTITDFSKLEIAQYKIDQDAEKAKQLALTAEAEAKAEAKSVAQAKLAALGLTVDDLKALGL